MNKLLVHGPEGAMVMCILEPGNLRKLQQGDPIEFSLNAIVPALPLTLSIVLHYSETPVKDAETFRKMVSPGGMVSDTRNAAVHTKRPHCPECSSVFEQLGVMKNDGPLAILFCPVCGCVLGAVSAEELANKTART